MPEVSVMLDDVRRWFEACGYLVSERVGEGGRVERFATPRKGLMPPRVWWMLVPRFPEDLGAATLELDRRREELGAERALAIVTDDVAPAGHRPDLSGIATSHVSARQLALYLAGMFEEASAIAQTPPGNPYFPYRIQDGFGSAADACEVIDAWIELGPETHLSLIGATSAATGEVLREVARRRAKRFPADPDRIAPVHLAGAQPSPMLAELIAGGWAAVAFVPPNSGKAAVLQRAGTPGAPVDLGSPRELTLAEPKPEEVIAWLQSHAPGMPVEHLRSWFQRDAAALHMFQKETGRAAILDAVKQETRAQDDTLWPFGVVARVFEGAMSRLLPVASNALVQEAAGKLEDAALEDFALGEASLSLNARILSKADLFSADEPESTATRRPQYKFASTVVRDWFLARKIAREVRSGRSDLLARHVFPREDVGHFLEVIAPDVAVLTGAGRAAELRRAVESEVARRVELTLGHQLNRSIGSLSAHVRTVRRAVREGEMDDRTRGAFLRIEEELDHLRKLTERSRLLNEARQWEIVSLPLVEIVAAVTDPLRERHPGVAVEIAIDRSLTVRAARDGLREVVHCLLENAFHSVSALPEGQPRNIEVAAWREGETVRMELKDNGIGVRPEDRERIFEPFVTTKTGGTGPRGTGLGLSIARTFAESMGTRVALESSNGETVFVLVLVAGDGK